MAVKQELEIVIDAEGNLRIKTHGLKGGDCEEELKPLEKALGKVTERERTSEYYEKSANQQQKQKTHGKPGGK